RGGWEVNPCSRSLDDCPAVVTEDHLATGYPSIERGQLPCIRAIERDREELDRLRHASLPWRRSASGPTRPRRSTTERVPRRHDPHRPPTLMIVDLTVADVDMQLAGDGAAS